MTKNSVEKQSKTTNTIQAPKSQSGISPRLLIGTIKRKRATVMTPHSTSLFPGFCLKMRQK